MQTERIRLTNQMGTHPKSCEPQNSIGSVSSLLDPLGNPWSVSPSLYSNGLYILTCLFQRIEKHKMINKKIGKHHDMEPGKFLSLKAS